MADPGGDRAALSDLASGNGADVAGAARTDGGGPAPAEDDPLDYSARVTALRTRLADRDVDAVVLFERGNVRYLTGWRQNTSSFSVVVVTPDEVRYLVPQLDLAAVRAECWLDDAAVSAFPEEEPIVEEVVDVVGDADRVGVEADSIAANRRDALAADCDVVDVGDAMAALRRSKTGPAVERYREGATVTSDVIATVLAETEPGDAERDLTARARQLMVSRGGEGPSFEPFAMAGEHAGMPHRTATARPVDRGELVVFDMGLVWHGYATDVTRTFLFGEPDPEQRRLFEGALAAQRAAVDAVEPGVRAETVHERAVEVLVERDLADLFPHLTGHGLGYDIHEAPIIDAGSAAVLEPGMVVTIEPGVYDPDVGGARVEDMVLVTETGHEVLTDVPRDLVTEPVVETIDADRGG